MHCLAQKSFPYRTMCYKMKHDQWAEIHTTIIRILAIVAHTGNRLWNFTMNIPTFCFIQKSRRMHWVAGWQILHMPKIRRAASICRAIQPILKSKNTPTAPCGCWPVHSLRSSTTNHWVRIVLTIKFQLVKPIQSSKVANNYIYDDFFVKKLKCSFFVIIQGTPCEPKRSPTPQKP